jgi:hypothetical protein
MSSVKATLWFFGVEQRGARVVMTLMPILMIFDSKGPFCGPFHGIRKHVRGVTWW